MSELAERVARLCDAADDDQATLDEIAKIDTGTDEANRALAQIASAAKSSSVQMEALRAFDRQVDKVSRKKAAHAALRELAVEMCERYPEVDSADRFALTFSGFVYASKSASPRELAIVRRQLEARADGLREQSIVLIGVLNDLETVPRLASMIAGASARDLIAIGRAFVALKRGAKEIKSLLAKLDRADEDAREPLIAALREALDRAAKP